MSNTRPSGLSVIPASSVIVSQEIIEIDERGRFNLLQRWTEQINWINSIPEAGIQTLMVFSEPGRISILDWETNGQKIIDRYQELAGSQDENSLELLRLIQDRYQKLIIRRDRRPYLGDAALHHLGLPISRIEKSTLYIAIYPDKLDLIGSAYRNQMLLSGHVELDNLP